jgi:S-DNA-T family DNA segregation ATPase FtsK/SpoIIIE
MLFYPVGKPKPVRIQGAYSSDKEIEKVVEYVKSQGTAEYDDNIIEEINTESEPQETNSGDNDELLPQAIDMVVDNGQASVSLIQRKFKVGYARAARIVDQMEARGIVGGFEGSKPRQILISKQQWQEMKMADSE